jgi:hypothetical protein
MKTTTNILFNWDGDMDAFFEEFGFRFTTVPEMIAGCYLCVFENADDFDMYDDWMEANGKVEVISGFSNKGKQYKAKKDKNKFKKSKYKKYLIPRFEPVLDENGEPVLDGSGDPTEVEVEVYQVNRYLGDSRRELEDE